VIRRLDRHNEEYNLGIRHFDHAIDTTHLTPERVAERVRELAGI
jgi:hypothetical protein